MRHILARGHFDPAIGIKVQAGMGPLHQRTPTLMGSRRAGVLSGSYQTSFLATPGGEACGANGIISVGLAEAARWLALRRLLRLPAFGRGKPSPRLSRIFSREAMARSSRARRDFRSARSFAGPKSHLTC